MDAIERRQFIKSFSGQRVLACMVTSAGTMTTCGMFDATQDQHGFWVGTSWFSLNAKEFQRTEVASNRVYLYYAGTTVAIRPAL
jgi:hypothetical protein